MLAHVHLGRLPQPHLHHDHHVHPDLRHLVRDAVLAAELAAVGVLIVSSVAPSAAVLPEPAAVTRVVDVAAVPVPATVAVVDAAGETVASAQIGADGWRFPDLAPGDYHLILSNEGPAIFDGDVALSAATATRTDPISVGAGEELVVSVHP